MAVNYQMDVINPFQAALQGYGAGAQILQQERTAERQVRQDEQQGQLFGLQMEQAKINAQKARAEMADAEAMKGVYAEYSDIMSQVRENNDPSLLVNSGIIERLAPINAKMAEYAQGQFTQMDEEKKAVAHKNVMGPAVAGMMGNWDVMTAQLQTQRDAYAASGDEEQVKLLDGMIAQSKDPKMREVLADTFLARAIDLNPKATGEQIDTLSKSIQLPLDQELLRAQINAQKASARLDAKRAEMEATTGVEVQSSKIMDDGTTVMTMKDGTRRVINPQGQSVEGEAAQQAIAQANKVGTALQGERAGARSGATLAQGQAKEAFVTLGNIRSNITNLDKVATLLDKPGVSTGVIESQLPTWDASTIELRNMRSRLGLDVVGAVTFGALSEGELNLALDVALPTNLSPPDLKKWVLSKKAAQEKLSNYFSEQVRFLSIPGNTLGDWEQHQINRSRMGAGSGTQNKPGIAGVKVIP
jgi:hypothetical protein